MPPRAPKTLTSKLAGVSLASLGALTLPAPAMIIAGGEAGNEAAKTFGAGSGGAICLLDILTANKLDACTGTLVRIDSKANKGYILTCAHSLIRPGDEPRAIAISFDPNPVANLKRTFATGYQGHPEYSPYARTGPDLALVEFTLPEGFSATPMALPSQEDFAGHAAPDTPFLFGGYGRFALNGDAKPDAKDHKAHPASQDWDASRENGRVRRIGYRTAGLRSLQETRYQRVSFEAKCRIASDLDYQHGLHYRPYSIVGGTHPIFSSPEFFQEVWPAPIDSGAPLFIFDAGLNQFKVMGVHGMSIFGETPLLRTPSVTFHATAVTPAITPWVLEAPGKGMAKVQGGAAEGLLVRTSYNKVFNLNLSRKTLEKN